MAHALVSIVERRLGSAGRRQGVSGECNEICPRAVCDLRGVDVLVAEVVQAGDAQQGGEIADGAVCDKACQVAAGLRKAEP